MFFTSDTHFGHENIIKHCYRDFESVEEMNETMISKWNNVVSKRDTIFHLGDFAYGKGAKTPDAFFNRLNGNKILIAGNHDGKHTKNLKWNSVHDIHEIKIDNTRIILCHYAMKVWNQHLRGSWMLHGHSHGSLPEDNTLSFDVGVDVWGFEPIHLDIVRKKMEYKMENPGEYLENYKVITSTDEFKIRVKDNLGKNFMFTPI